MEQGVGLLSSKMETRLKAAPDLRLLLELEPAPQVFFRNLTDLILRRPLPPDPAKSKPGRFWTDVFVPTGLPWGSFIESMLLHLALISVVATVGQSWVRQEQIRREIEHKAFVAYYMPSKTFPTNRSRPPEQARPKRERNSQRQSPTRVAREQAKTEVKPPDVKLDRDRRPDSVANSASTRTPLFAPKLPQPMVPAGPTSVVAPAQDISQATSRQAGLPPTSVVAPAPMVGGLSSGRTLAAPNAAVVAPPPPALRSATANSRGVNLGHSEVVAPTPHLSVLEQRNSGTVLASLGGGATIVPPPQSVPGAGAGRVTSGLVALVVPPPPSVAGKGSRKGSALLSGSQVVPPPQALGSSAGVSNGRVSSGLVALVVPPPPAVLGDGRSGGSARIGSLSGSQVVPPTPTVASVGVRAGSGRGNSLSDGGSQVVPPTQSLNGSGVGSGRRSAGLGAGIVPPPPSVARGGAGPGSGRGNSLSDGGSQVVPPPQSMKNSGGVANGRMGSGLGSQAVAPAPVVSGTGGSAARQMSAILGTGAQPVPPPPSPAEGGANSPGSGSTAAMDTNQAVPPPPAMDNSSDPATIELPVRVIGLALALPTSSYFSNYEVFIAERRLKKGGSELIKLVSVSLPYQPRLSEYGINNSKVYKLHVTRDPSCDESLLQMTWPEEKGPPPEPQLGTGTTAPGPGNGRDKLPCYRTTADEYWRALSGNR
jgi:hypothetical protein